MADPITMAVVGGSIGAMTNKKDPLKGALLGAAGGYGGGALMGASGLGAGATQVAGSGSALTGAGASTAANTAFMAPASVNPGTMIGASQAAPAGIFANPVAYTPSSNVAVERSFGTLESMLNPNIQSSSMAPSFMEQVGSGAGQVGQFAQQNPVLTGMALQSAQQMMQRPEAPMAPAGQVSRGQIQGGDYMSLLNPQQSTVLRPQPISLLG